MLWEANGGGLYVYKIVVGDSTWGLQSNKAIRPGRQVVVEFQLAFNNQLSEGLVYSDEVFEILGVRIAGQSYHQLGG